jgi:hypothetical protein
MLNYDSINEAEADLKKRGYTVDFDLKPDGLKCNSLDIKLHPEEFTIDEHYRFEGDSDPDESSVIYAISSSQGIKGTLTDAYGVYAANVSPAMASKLQVKQR